MKIFHLTALVPHKKHTQCVFQLVQKSDTHLSPSRFFSFQAQNF